VRFRLVAALALAAHASGVAAAQGPDKPPRQLATDGLAGESVALLPVTLALADAALRTDSGFIALGDHQHLLRWADSVIAEEFRGRSPEVTWLPAPRLRQLARRNPGMIPDPDQMGQAILRAPKLTKIPDPLRSSLRSLIAVTGGRYAMAPAALGFSRDSSGGLRADLALALADGRGGTVIWRSQSFGRGASPGEALAAAVDAVLPGLGTGP
jgi:hypothetical protein